MVETQVKKEWLGDLIQDGFYDKLVIIGFPYDQLVSHSARQGSDLGPGKSCSLADVLSRRFSEVCEGCWGGVEP